MIKSIFEFQKMGLNTAIIGDNSIPEYQFDAKYLCEENGAFEYDEHKLNLYYSSLFNQISNEISNEQNFKTFCPKFTKKEYRGFSKLHPSQKKRDVQGAGEIVYRVQEYIKDVTGLFAVTTQTAVGFTSKITAIKMALEYFKEQGKEKQNIVYITESKVNDAKIANWAVKNVVIGKDIKTSLEAIESAIDENTALVVLNNLFFGGLTTENITKVSEIAHKNNALVYGESDSFAKLLSVVRPADLGVDIFEFNAEKLFNLPTLNGFAPLAVCEKLEKFLPKPYAVKDKSGSYTLLVSEKDNWQISAFVGNINACVSLYAYLSVLGSDGLRNYAEITALNCEYLNHLSKTKSNLTPSECDDFSDIENFVKQQK